MFDGDVIFVLPHIDQGEFLVLVVVQWMAWTRFMLDMFGANPKLQTPKVSLVCLSGSACMCWPSPMPPMIFMSICHVMVELVTILSGLAAFVVGLGPPKLPSVLCMGCHSPPICLDVCHAKILYFHFASLEMSCACIHLGVHNHPMFIGVCRESLDMAFLCVANEVSKTSIIKNSTIVMAASKQFMFDYILKSPLPRELNHRHGASLEVVMDRFSTLAYPNYMKFMVGSK